jgi:hypothetical protein
MSEGYVSLGKYDNARDDALHYLCLAGWSNGEFGTMEFGAYNWRISNDWEDVKPENGEFNSLIEEWFELNPEVEDDSIFRRDLVGHFHVIEASNGMVSVIAYDSKEERDENFLKLEAAFNEWDDSEPVE